MDYELEKRITNSFFYHNFRPRLTADLRKDRKEFIHKMCHSYDKFMLPECISNRANRNPLPAELCEKMRANGVENMCYVMSSLHEFDGINMRLEDAIEGLHCNGFASFIIGLPSGFTYFKGESWGSHQPNLFLKPKLRFDGVPWNA